jgi:hypothetical protein
MSSVDFDGRNQIVAKVLGRDVTRGELSEAFDKVADKANWKMPIDATVGLNTRELVMLTEAIVFFTGCVPNFTLIPGEARGKRRKRYQVKAAGYYQTIGA